MNLLDKIKADIARHELMACHDLQGQLAAIDVKALAVLGTDNETPSYSVDNRTATIKVRGLLIPSASRDYGNWITGYNYINQYLAKANNDPFVDEIVLDIDSGGGYVKGLDDVIETIANLSKPISAYASGDMYSGAYYLGSSTDRITAEKDSGIGSIGVFVVHSEESKALEKWGETYSIFRSGKWKGAFNWFSPLAKHEKERLQQGVDEAASLFFNHVAYKRNIDTMTIADWQGDTFSATKAKELGLIDEIVGKTAANSPTQVENTTKADFSATSTQNPINPMEDTMDLVQALAENSNLKAQVAEKETALASKDAKIAELQAKLTEQQAESRNKAVADLEAKTGKTFSDAEKQAFAGMSDEQFALVASMAESNKPVMPASLQQAQITAGNTESTGLAGVVANLAKGANNA
nr:S49 family peptidase [Moraxella sp.]